MNLNKAQSWINRDLLRGPHSGKYEIKAALKQKALWLIRIYNFPKAKGVTDIYMLFPIV